jgi:hypothetical protein
MKDEVERLTFAMQKFCLAPNKATFDEICACTALKRADADNFIIWRDACLYKYSGDLGWGDDQAITSVDDHRKEDDRGDYEGDFMTNEGALCEKTILTPTKSAAIQVMYMFYATGELKYIDLYYQCMGHERLPMQTKQYLARLYAETKKMYKDEVLILLMKNPAHFDTGAGRGMRLDVAGFTYFDDINSITAQLDELQNVSMPLARRPEHL